MNRELKVFPKNRWAHNSQAEKWGVPKRNGRPLSRELLILGTGRTRTKFYARLFKEWGLDLKHERTGEFGSSTHFYHADHDWYPMFPWMDNAAHVGERLSDFNFGYTLHVVRHPLTCIPSIAAVFGTIDWEFAEETGVLPAQKMSKLERVMHYYYHLNKKLEMISDRTMQVENTEQTLPNIMYHLGYADLPWPDLPPQNRGTGYRRSQPATWAELSTENKTLAQDIKKMAKRYGYEV